ncbi:unnamed protein product [Mytilus coruscus]|uniref:Uncharacterized protein n=1 Tax=Mytilus coruscus TaxID=42192 RepID=A0A6J7ZXJ5_MYTCO|nr:unnamed protein product [Mytilus coruscus]
MNGNVVQIESFMKEGYVHEKDFCFGKSRPVECNITEKISIRDISYERNCASCICTYYKNSTCAEFRLPGSWKNNFYYEAVSGLKQKEIMIERVSCPNMAQIFTNQVHLKYECISDNHAMNFCAFKKTEGPTVHLQYGFSTLSTSTRNCKCKAFTTLGNLQVQAVDIRFQNDSSGICAKNQNTYLGFDSVNQVIKCQDKQLIGGYETIFNSSKSSMDILLHLDGTRPIIWIAVLAPSGGNVSVVCDNTDVTVGQRTSTTMERSTVDPIHTSNKESLATTVHVEIDTTLPNELTSTHSEGMNQATSAHSKGINPMIFSHSKVVNTTTFTNSEIINLVKSTHLEVVNQTTSVTFVQTNTNHSINPTTVTNHPTIAESMSKMKAPSGGNVSVVYDNTDVTEGQRTSTTTERSTVDPIHTSNTKSLATTVHVEIDTTLPNELTSTHSEGMNQATSAHSKGINPMIFSHSKVVNTTTFTNSEIINLVKSTHLEVVNQTTSATFVQTNTNHSIKSTTVTNHPTIAESMSKIKDDNIDPAIIVLVLTGSLTLVLIIVGIIIGRMKYINQRQDRISSDDIPERKNLDKANTSIRMNLYQEIGILQRPTSRSGHITYPTMKEDQPAYSQVQKKRRSDQISDQYDHVNYMGSFKSKAHSNIYDKSNTINYDHCQLPILSSDCHYHDKLELNNSETSFRRNILVHPHDDTSPNKESGVNIDEQHINPYVDETVIKGMKNDYELRKSLSHSIDVYEGIRDMMTHATSWAEEDSL